MAERKAAEQLEHDEVLRVLASIYHQRSFDVMTNPNTEKNWGFDGRYPDVVVVSDGRGGRYVFEIETSDSVSHAEARSQWADYDCAWPDRWYLAVPADEEPWTCHVLINNNISHCTVVTWWKRKDGGYAFQGLPGL